MKHEVQFDESNVPVRTKHDAPKPLMIKLLLKYNIVRSEIQATLLLALLSVGMIIIAILLMRNPSQTALQTQQDPDSLLTR